MECDKVVLGTGFQVSVTSGSTTQVMHDPVIYCNKLKEINDRLTRERDAMMETLKQISSLWPEPPNCADIMAVNGINDGRSRAIVASTAIGLARSIIALCEAPQQEGKK